MKKVPCVAFLGRPMLLDKSGDPVAVKTRKALAILGFLSRSVNFSAPRETLADMLWSTTPRQKGMQSLRQAIRQVKDAERCAGVEIMVSADGQLRLDRQAMYSDQDLIMDLIGKGGRLGFESARSMWRGDFLSGCEDIDPQFAEWLPIEQERVRALVVAETLKHLGPAAIRNGADHVESAVNFLLHIDPAHEAAHRIMIRFHLASGQRELAEQQYRDLERELRELDEIPDAETRALLDGQPERPSVENTASGSGEAEPSAFWRPSGGSFSAGSHNGTGSLVQLPSLSIILPQLPANQHMDSTYLKEEIVAGLSSYRSFDLFQSDHFEDLEEGSAAVLMRDQELGGYLLRFQHNERTGNLSVQFEDRREGRIIFNEIIDLREWDSAQAAASQTVVRIHEYVMDKLRNPGLGAAYAKWCQIEALMADFDPASDLKAQRLFVELERHHSSFSRLYAAKSLIGLKKMICYPIDDNNRVLSKSEILSLSEHALNLDPWHALNQRAFGLASLKTGDAEHARRAFLQAGRLNGVDPINLISVAEGLAFAGDVDQARRKADAALGLFTAVPRIFNSYFSNVHFAAGDYEQAATAASKISFNYSYGLTTRVAALVCAGKENEALDVLRLNSDRYHNTIMPLGQSSPDAWAEEVNFFQDPKTRAAYARGVELVKRFFFGDRAALS